MPARKRRNKSRWLTRQWRGLKNRWKAKTPVVFKRVIGVSAAVSGVAVAVQGALMAAGAMVPSWWQDAFPYLVGIPAGASAVAKFTREDEQQPKPRQPRKPRAQRQSKKAKTAPSFQIDNGNDNGKKERRPTM